MSEFVTPSASTESVSPATGDTFLRLERVSRSFPMDGRTINALQDVSLDIEQGEVLIVLGPSGSGKTTLLNVIGGVDRATSGEIWHNGRNLALADRSELTRYRRDVVGFVFQFYNLVTDLTAAENVELAAELCTAPQSSTAVLEQVGLAERKDHFPSQLSGGEQQRVAIARALVKNPTALLCDEPTGALDYETGKQVLQLLVQLSRRLRMTVIIVTHNSAICPIGNRIARMRSGSIAELEINAQPISPAEIRW